MDGVLIVLIISGLAVIAIIVAVWLHFRSTSTAAPTESERHEIEIRFGEQGTGKKATNTPAPPPPPQESERGPARGPVRSLDEVTVEDIIPHPVVKESTQSADEPEEPESLAGADTYFQDKADDSSASPLPGGYDSKPDTGKYEEVDEFGEAEEEEILDGLDWAVPADLGPEEDILGGLEWLSEEGLEQEVLAGETLAPPTVEIATESPPKPTKPAEPSDSTDETTIAEAHFTAFYSRESVAETPYGLYVYAHLEGVLRQIEADVQAFQQQLGGDIPKPKIAAETKNLAVGTALTIMPEAEGLEFDPVAVTKKWQTPFTRFDFTYTAPESMVAEIITGRVVILVRGIEIASIPFATMIEDEKLALQFEAMPQNPLAAAKFAASDTAQIYNKIFVSYSRQDKAVAENYRLAQLALGHDVFMDSYSIRTGEDWQAALANAIDTADIFQLFWSEHSANSSNVHNEWDYALRYRCAEDACRGFIRPVFWHRPMPAPPLELGHLNFRYVPLAGE